MRKHSNRIIGFVLVVGTLVLFQNCGAGISMTSLQSSSSAVLSSTTSLTGGDPSASPTPVPTSATKPIACLQPAYNLDALVLRLSSVAANGKTCLDYGNGQANTAVGYSACMPSTTGDLRLKMNLADCHFEMQVAPSIAFTNLGNVAVESLNCIDPTAASSDLKLSACSAVSVNQWSVTQTGATAVIKSSDGRCLTVKSNSATTIEACDGSTAQQIQFIDSYPGIPTTQVLNNPILLNYWDSAGIHIQVDNFSLVSGFDLFTLTNDPNGKFLELNKENSALEFTFTAQADGIHILSPNYGAASDTGFDVIQDGVNLGRMKIRSTLDRRIAHQGGGGFAVTFVKGKPSKIRLQNVGVANPIRLFAMHISTPISVPMPKFGLAADISATAVTTLVPTQVSEIYRLYLDVSNPAAPVWNCPWTHCFIEYKINVLKAGNYELKFDYMSGNTSPQGKRLLLDGKFVSTLSLPMNTTASASWKIALTAGPHFFKLDHPDYDLGALGASVTTGNVYFTPVP